MPLCSRDEAALARCDITSPVAIVTPATLCVDHGLEVPVSGGRYRWDPAILGALAERPHRFRELLKQIEKHTDGHVDDNAVLRGLDRLTRAQHVRKTGTQVGKRVTPIYTITNEGRRRLQMYADFINIYQRLHPPYQREAASPTTTAHPVTDRIASPRLTVARRVGPTVRTTTAAQSGGDT